MKYLIFALFVSAAQMAKAADTNKPVTIFVQVDLCSKTQIIISDNGDPIRATSNEMVPVVLGPAYVNVVQIGWYFDSKCSSPRTTKIYNSKRELIGETVLRVGENGNRYFAFTFEHDTETVEKSEHTASFGPE